MHGDGVVAGTWMVALVLALAVLGGCEDTNIRLAGQAGKKAVQALTLSEEDVQTLSERSRERLDAQHTLAPPGSRYAERLQRLTRGLEKVRGQSFNYAAYLDDQVNAFALGDGTIRVYSGLMDMLSDQELLFVLGHEIGHVLNEDVQDKMRLALVSSALRAGFASQQNVVGDVARSALGAFVHRLVNAQFSQQEEREADDFGLRFLRRKGGDPQHAVSALEQLATLGSGHSFLSSHPAPQKRAQRLRERVRTPEKQSEPEASGWLEKGWNLVLRLVSWGLGLLQGVVQWALQLVGGAG